MASFPLKVTSTKKRGDYEIKTYDVTKLQNLGQGVTLSKMMRLLSTVGAPMTMSDEGTALGYFNGTEKFRVAFKGDRPVAVHMKGELEDYPETEKFNKKFGAKVFGKSGGLRLDVQGGRTKRNGRGRKRRQLRKLTTRRR